jgi:hypothetical protein
MTDEQREQLNLMIEKFAKQTNKIIQGMVQLGTPPKYIEDLHGLNAMLVERVQDNDDVASANRWLVILSAMYDCILLDSGLMFELEKARQDPE